LTIHLKLEAAMIAHGLIWFLLVGLIAGWLAGRIMKGGSYGLMGDLVVGVLGSVIGGWVFGVLGLAAWGFVGHILVALAGALILLYVIRVLKKA
jgi:uncharacterized membrane protein YeaQ/YmgE (transglycosylase-associated protein family)